MDKIVYTSCPHDCGGKCLLKVHVENGVIKRIETDDGEEPQLRACLRGRAQRKRVYAPDRLKYPMIRVGERGEGKFKRVSWDEALNLVANELKRVKDTYGPEAILYIGYLGIVLLFSIINLLFIGCLTCLVDVHLFGMMLLVKVQFLLVEQPMEL